MWPDEKEVTGYTHKSDEKEVTGYTHKSIL